MTLKPLQSNGLNFAYTHNGADFMSKQAERSKPCVLWAHGWGQSHSAFLPLITPLEGRAHHVALDFPGFGASPPPDAPVGTADIADALAAHLKSVNAPPVLWVGHSFGCRIGLQMAARHPECIAGLCLIAAAGLKRKRPLLQKLYFKGRIALFKSLKKFVPEGDFKGKLLQKFGSADYQKSGPMRAIFVRVVNEDLTDIAKTITCPVTLVFGQNDTETPPEFGVRYNALIPRSTLYILNNQDHYSVLSTGRHPVIKIISDLIKAETPYA